MRKLVQLPVSIRILCQACRTPACFVCVSVMQFSTVGAQSFPTKAPGEAIYALLLHVLILNQRPDTKASTALELPVHDTALEFIGPLVERGRYISIDCRNDPGFCGAMRARQCWRDIHHLLSLEPAVPCCLIVPVMHCYCLLTFSSVRQDRFRAACASSVPFVPVGS
jgi:hypothetical protein